MRAVYFQRLDIAMFPLGSFLSSAGCLAITLKHQPVPALPLCRPHYCSLEELESTAEGLRL